MGGLVWFDKIFQAYLFHSLREVGWFPCFSQWWFSHVNNNVDAKSDIPSLESTYYVYVWKVWCKSGQFLIKISNFDPQWPWPWPHRNEPLKGNSRVSPHTLTKFCEIGPKNVGENQMWPLGSNDLDLCRNKPLKGNSGVSPQYTHVPTHWQILLPA
jgi:hypothetical protein